MTDLNQTTLRGILARVTSVNEAFIVPKQGNWWNPQDLANKPHTWCAYLIRSNKPICVPFYDEGTENGAMVEGVATQRIATIDLQFVGPQAETIAQSVGLWPLRSDVQEELKQVRGAMMNDGMEAVSSNFYQDGTNNVVAWNVTIKVLWYQVIDTNQGIMPTIQFNGHIN